MPCHSVQFVFFVFFCLQTLPALSGLIPCRRTRDASIGVMFRMLAASSPSRELSSVRWAEVIIKGTEATVVFLFLASWFKIISAFGAERPTTKMRDKISPDTTWPGQTRQHETTRDKATRTKGKTRQHKTTQYNKRQDIQHKTRQQNTMQHNTMQDERIQDTTGQDKTTQDNTSQDKTTQDNTRQN